MKLKTILEAASDEQKVDEFLSLVNSGRFIVDRYPIFRGVQKPVKNFEIRTIRKNRRPKDTEAVADFLYEEYRKLAYSDRPSRQKSIFGSYNYGVAEQFAKKDEEYYVTIIFPEKGSNIWASKHDTYHVIGLGDLMKNNLPKLARILETYGIEKLIDNISGQYQGSIPTASGLKFLYHFSLEAESGRGVHAKICAKMLNKLGVDNVAEELKYLKIITSKHKHLRNIQDVDEKHIELISLMAGTLYGYVSRIPSYFEDYIYPISLADPQHNWEIIVEGDSYLAVNYEWFNTYLSYDRRKGGRINKQWSI